MAFLKNNLTLLMNGGGLNVWAYRTTEAPAVVDTAGYFTGDAVNMLRVGDTMLVQQVDNPAAPTVLTASGWHNVLSNDGTIVDISDATVIAMTDTD